MAIEMGVAAALFYKERLIWPLSPSLAAHLAESLHRGAWNLFENRYSFVEYFFCVKVCV